MPDDTAPFALVVDNEDPVSRATSRSRPRSYAAEPDKLVEQLRVDEAIAEADARLLTVPKQLGVDYNAT